MFGKKRKTENVVISLAEYKSLQWQATMLSSIINARPEERKVVAESIARYMAGRMDGGKK